MMALVGPSGSGKSTLLSLLLRFYDPVRGRIEIDQHDIRDFTIASLRSQISVVLQDTILFAASVLDNIRFGAANATEERVVAAARGAGADGFIRALPQGYATILGERGVNLSHGQRQRIAIARATLREARLLLLDEPTTGLDQRNKQIVCEALRRLIAGRTTVLVTHDLTEAMQADEICYFESGRVLERGTHNELIATDGRYAQLFRLQSQDHTSANSYCTSVAG
jgi:ATP-binding cassette subfamily B protein